MKHISIRVPWHDNNWQGTICKCPSENPFCLTLKNIAESKDNDKEGSLAGEEWCEISELKSKEPPYCSGENGGFMNKNPYKRLIRHVYAWGNNPHVNLLPTLLEIPSYTFSGTPFRYLNSKNEAVQSELDKRIPQIAEDEPNEYSNWVYGSQRQYDILNWFRSNIQANQSLVVAYCKNNNPIDDDSKRMIIGLGEITKVHKIYDYNVKPDFDSNYPFWEVLMEHSIRPDLKESKGFLLPYKEYLDLSEEVIKAKTGKTKYQVLDEIKFTLDKVDNNTKIFNELSYGCEYISNHSMLIILNAARKCVEAVISHKLVGGDWQKQLLWIDEQISKVKEMIGPFPSFAETLRAIGVNYAYLIEQDLRNNGFCGTKDNPWEAFDKLINGKISLNGAVYQSEMKNYKQTWKFCTAESKQVLELLSRFEISAEIIEEWLEQKDRYNDLIENPYLISEECDLNYGNYITTEMIDLGVIADVSIQGDWIPQSPSVLTSKINERRIRSLVIHKLKIQLLEGDTLLSITEIEDYVKSILEKDNLKLPVGYFDTTKEFMEQGNLVYVNSTMQLKEYYEIEEFLRKIFIARTQKTVKNPVAENWDSVVKESIKQYDPNNPRSCAAVTDQVKAVEMFSKYKMSVLTGAAGTGKTAVVQAFLSSPQIQNEGVLLLAPTGKARVRLASMANGVQAKTIAQFLTRQGFFDWYYMEAYVPEDYKSKQFSEALNVIVDECSMITSKDMYVLLKVLDLGKINRVIFIGDPYQLPPIGAGKPFADLCNYLGKDGDGNHDALTHLQTVVRTIQTGESDVLSLASWFAGNKPYKSADEVIERIIQDKLSNDLVVYTWKDASELKDKLREVLEKELPNKDLSLDKRIQKSIGLDDIDKAYANPDVVEQFQILSPVKNPVWGTLQLNADMQEWVGHKKGQYSMEIVPEFVAYADKVIQLVNEKRYAFKAKQKLLLSNGQIGFAKFAKKDNASIVFSGYPNESFTYYPPSSDGADSPIELAYAITIHKSQGSDFDTVLVVLPKNGRILSRELIYTALTRAKKRLILLVEDNFQWIMEYSKPQNSELAKRNSNLLKFSVRTDKVKDPYPEGLIHITKDHKLLVRSKSEVIIANELINAGIEFEYEKLLEENGSHRIPDFTFVDAAGETIIWEHLGMLSNPAYKESWERKLKFYHSIGFKEGENLFTTEDHENGAIDTTEVMAVIEKIKNLLI